MFDLDHWQEIFSTLRENRVRTLLTAFSVAWGIFMLVILLGMGNGLENSTRYRFRDDAMNSIWIWSGRTSIPYKGLQPGRRIQFENSDYAFIRDNVKGVEHITSRFFVPGEFTVRYKDKYSTFQVRSCHPDHRYLEKTIMIKGRFLNPLDLSERRKVAVIGTKVREVLFGAEDPIGKWIAIRGIRYRVIGLYKDEGGEGELRMIYIPITTAQTVYGGEDDVSMMMYTFGDASLEESELMRAETEAALAERHIFSTEDKRAVNVRNNLANYQRFGAIFDGIRIFLWIVGIGTIIAGIIGIGNIMLISVKERTKEIGIRKSLGATPFSIISSILQEALLITLTAGYVGLFLGILSLEFLKDALKGAEWIRNPEVNMGVVIGATVILVVAGTFAGFFPARQAARIHPVEAMRR